MVGVIFDTLQQIESYLLVPSIRRSLMESPESSAAAHRDECERYGWLIGMSERTDTGSNRIGRKVELASD